MPTITTTSVPLISVGALIQNLGPDDLFITDVDPATEAGGFKLDSGDATAVGSGRSYYAISHGTSDVRTLAGASSLFKPPA